jgi:hypothetical protein
MTGKPGMRVIYIVIISALVFLSSTCIAWMVAHLFLSVHLEISGMSRINGGNGMIAFG